MYDHVLATSAKGFSAHVLPLGGQEPIRDHIRDFHPPNRLGLSAVALHETLLELKGYGLTPSTSMTSGLEAVADTLEAMAEDSLPPRVHLSSLDPGVGKTTLIKHFIKSLLSSPDHEEVAVLVCFSLLVEVERMQTELKALGIEVGVWTGDDEVNAKGALVPAEARVLLTTQNKLKAAHCYHDRFSDIRGFHYLGEPRQVRVWDESLMPGSETQLSADAIAGLFDHLRRPAPKLCAALEELHDQLRQATSGDILDFRDLEEMGGIEGVVEVHRLLQSAEVSPLDKQRLERLQQVSGQLLPVYRSNNGKVSVLGYRKTLLPGLAPLLVLDASGRCRHTYDLLDRQVGSLVRLPGAEKDYSQLLVHLWDKGSGQSSHINDAEGVLLRGIAQAIGSRPTEDWLIVIHKGLLPDFKDRLRAHLGDQFKGKLHFLTWGSHHGTNDFATVPNVVLASLLFLPPEVYDTRVRLCAGMKQTTVVKKNERKAMAEGELLHDILQALCRASVRGIEADGRCPPCRAWIIAARQTRLREHLPKLFPGCQLEDWRPKGVSKLSGRIREALAYIDRMEDEGFGDEFTFPELADELQMSRKDFRKQVAKDPRFLDEVAGRGYVAADLERQTSKGTRKAKGICRVDDIFPVDHSADFALLDPD